MEKAGPNRNQSKNHSAAIAKDIRDGVFYTTHQGIAFDVEGVLVDGQHRLAAIVAADRGVWLLVTRGLAKEAMIALDSGRLRSLSDRLTITDGENRSHHFVAAARIIAFLEEGTTHPTDASVVALARREHAAIEWVIQRRRHHERYTTSSPIAAAVAYALPTNPAKVEEFMIGLATGENLAKGSPILALRAFVDRNGNSSQLPERWRSFRAALAAEMYFCRGEKIQILRDSDQGVKWIIAARKAAGLPVGVGST